MAYIYQGQQGELIKILTVDKHELVGRFIRSTHKCLMLELTKKIGLLVNEGKRIVYNEYKEGEEIFIENPKIASVHPINPLSK